jgi:hypothetical protein
MSTPISDRAKPRQAARAAACLVALVLLAGCGGDFLRDAGANAPTQVAVTQDLVVVTGPEGYCVDPTATRNSEDTGFVLLGNCAAIANSRRAVQPATPAILTAAVAAPSGGGRLADSMADLDAFFRSEDGLRLISRAGDPASVTILETQIADAAFLLHATDTSAGAIDGVQPDYWRAYLDIGNRLATLSVLALEDRALSRDESLAALLAFVSAVRAANPDPGAPALPPASGGLPPGQGIPLAPGQPVLAPVPVAQPPQTFPPEGQRLFNVGLFRRIFAP